MSHSTPNNSVIAAPASASAAEARARAMLAAAPYPADKAALFAILVEAGIKTVVVEFDGAGDSGQIDVMVAHTGEATIDLSTPAMAVRDLTPEAANPVGRMCPVAEAIEALAYDCLDEAQGGWENNDGAFGTFTFDVAARTIQLEFNERVMETAYSEYVF